MNQKAKPEWQLFKPPQYCERCERPFPEDRFEKRIFEDPNDNAGLLQETYCTWCKECYEEFLEEGEQ
jgi:hypothetical protein